MAIKETLSKEPGTYALLLRADSPQQVVVGALGSRIFPQGWYLYLGSAHGPGGLAARLARHQRQRDKRLFWHIDYLRAVTTLAEIWTHDSPDRQECQWAAVAGGLPGAKVLVSRFGASDCRCPSHLFHYTWRPKVSDLERSLEIVLKRIDKT